MTAEMPRGQTGLFLVLLAFLAVNLLMFAASGVRLGGDTPLYLEGAQGLLAGEPLTARQPSYLGYIAVVAMSQWSGLGLTGLMLLQILAATVAAAVVFRMGAELGGQLAGLLAVVLLTLDVDTNRWHAYVLADSLYASMLTITVWLVYRAAGKQALGFYVSASVLLVAAALIRPEGWFLIPAAVVYWIVRGTTGSSRRWAGLAAVAASCVLLVAIVAPRLSGNVQAVGPGEMLRNGQTIWDYDGWRLSMPAAPPDDGRYGSAGSAVAYAVQHPISTIALMAARLGVHFAHVRPFFSTPHNALVVVWLVPVYAFGIFTLWRLGMHPLARWGLIVIATQSVVVALTHADWDGRYLAHVLPLWYPVAATGAVLAVGRWRPREAMVAHG